VAQCQARTKNGQICQNSATPGRKYCHIHRYYSIRKWVLGGVTIGLLSFIGFVADIFGISSGLSNLIEQLMPNSATSTSVPSIDNSFSNSGSVSDSNIVINSGNNNVINIGPTPQPLEPTDTMEPCGPNDKWILLLGSSIERGNGSFESGDTYGWQIDSEGIPEINTYTLDDRNQREQVTGIDPGNYFLERIKGDQAILYKYVDLTNYEDEINAAQVVAGFNIYLRIGNFERAWLTASFLDLKREPIEIWYDKELSRETGVGETWENWGRETQVPINTVWIQLKIRVAKTDNGENIDVSMDEASIEICKR
jgi:hypothetical protein